MKLISVRVTHYRSVDDSTEFSIEPDVTCLVGKNESGKTAVLHAMLRLNPEQTSPFDVTRDYPRVHLNNYKKRHEAAPETPVVARFQLDDGELSKLEAALGKGVLTLHEVTVARDYKNTLRVEAALNEAAHVDHVVRQCQGLDPTVVEEAAACPSLVALQRHLEGLTEKPQPVQALTQRLKNMKPLAEQVAELLTPFVPKFMYFGDYDVMRGSAELGQLQNPGNDAGLRTLRALLDLASIQPNDLRPSLGRYEDHKASLESTANSISDDAFRYWRQNPELEVEFDVAQSGAGENPQSVLHVRIKNRRHRVTVPFDERSKGFVWFFSFLARFNQIAQSKQPLILLLDEPGLSLHASAQADFLKFINERLAEAGYQVIYTTHSPFMVEPDRLHRVRTVEDKEKVGTVVSTEWLKSERQTWSPLLAALGIEVAQGLMVGPNNLLVEGASDLLYLQAMSEVVEKAGKAGLSRRWVVLPVHGADRLSFFSAFMKANQLRVAVLMDVDGKDQQRLKALTKEGALDPKVIIKVAEFLPEGTQRGDLEDLFEVDDYVRLASAVARTHPPLSVADLPPGDRVTKRIQTVIEQRGGSGWNHTEPAKHLARDPLAAQISATTTERFAALFARLNSLLPQG